MKILESIGASASEIEQICSHYKTDQSGMCDYYLYLRAAYDDRHEYV